MKIKTINNHKIKHTGKESHLMKEIMLTTQKAVHTFAGNFGISGSSLMVLRTLAFDGRRDTGVMEMAGVLGVDAGAVTRLVQKLEKGGFLTRKKGADRRESLLRLTPSGMAKLRQAHGLIHEFEGRIGRNVGKKKVLAAIDVLQNVREEFMKFNVGGRT